MKPTSNFKLKKKYKMLLCNFTDKATRNHIKKLLIQAQLIEDASERVVFK